MINDVAFEWPRARPFAPSDRQEVIELLEICSQLYPGGDKWLKRRLTDALHGRADCTLLQAPQVPRICVVAISTPKPNGRVKLSTFFVAESYRNNGLGKLLLAHLMDRWDQQGVRESYVTVAHHLERPLAQLIEPSGFIKVATDRNRYGPGRHETVWARTAVTAEAVVVPRS